MKTDDSVNERDCSKCGDTFSRTHFTDGQWRGNHGTHHCRGCMVGPNSATLRGKWTCKAPGCQFSGDKSFFRLWIQTQGNDGRSHGKEKCNACFVPILWRCKAPLCNFTGPESCFSLWLEKQKQQRQNGWEKCNACFEARSASKQQALLRASDLEHIQSAPAKKPRR